MIIGKFLNKEQARLQKEQRKPLMKGNESDLNNSKIVVG